MITNTDPSQSALFQKHSAKMHKELGSRVQGNKSQIENLWDFCKNHVETQTQGSP